jgi:acyl-CoA synthetase (AMP-forming)/AMP-acid ligase II
MPDDSPPAPHTLVYLLRQQAERYRDKVAFSFSYNGDDENKSQLTYRELDLQARAIAVGLQTQDAAGERVLVFCRPGLAAVAGYFGCLYAGAVAVPVHERLAPRLSSVVPDAQATFALAAPETPAKVKTAADTLVALIGGQPLRWCDTDADAADAERWVAPDVAAGTTAMIQYTSGSTAAPNGVVLSHGNLMHNVAATSPAWHRDDDTIAVWWLPQHHDMGLIGGILEMLYVGATTMLMSPSAFIQRPMRWLEAMSRHRATMTCAPNFAYNLCVERSTPAERAALDLSSLSVAMNGAEPVRADTMAAFAEAFAPAGFRPDAFLPVYGLAEATLLVSGGSEKCSASPRPVVHHIDRAALETDRVVDATPNSPTAVTLVGCGRPRGGQRIVIVDPETRRECGPDEVGEIWIAGPSVGQGYWGKPDETAQTFAASLADTGAGPFLRTGDLGFLRAGELFITGRCKDLVVIGGANYYPNDIEMTVQDCHPVLVSGRGAVFAIAPEQGGADQLVVAHEVDRDRISEAELHEIVDGVQAAMSENHRIQADSVVLVQAMRIPTTSSGKIQRSACRQQFLDHTLDTVAEWYAPKPPGTAWRNPEEARLAEILEVAAARQQQAARDIT